MEKILKIEKTSFNLEDYWANYDGYIVTTDKQEIKVGIENGQSCCESWGEFMSQDDLSEFIGAYLLEVYVTDTELRNYDLERSYEGDIMFVNFRTTNGVFQFVAYNDHNGYYGHSAVVVSEQLKYRTTL